jgi:hypothetical protein
MTVRVFVESVVVGAFALYIALLCYAVATSKRGENSKVPVKESITVVKGN